MFCLPLRDLFPTPRGRSRDQGVRSRRIAIRQTGAGRWALAVALGVIVMLLAAPAALAQGAGAIAGKVTEASTKSPLGDIEVTVYEAGELGFPVGFAMTNAKGEYTVGGLASGSYKVEFAPAFESGLNFVTQYYNDESSLAAANPVAVAGGTTTPEINAELQVGGEIEGIVSEAETHTAQEGIEVAVFANGSEFPSAYATTNAEGRYTVAGLASGSYKVEFSAGFESGRNFVTQYYKDQRSLTAANPVSVVQPNTTENINAELVVGGEIEGTVTDASTHAPVPEALVVALGTGESVEGVAFTNANGQYTIAGLATGAYRIGFASGQYITQYYNDQSSFASANPVPAIEKSTTPGVNASLVPRAPVNTAAPVASGTPAVGQTLLCTSGSWTGSPRPTYTYSWLRDGVAIAGAIANTYTVQMGDQGNGLTCKVTATNKNGAAAAVSNTLIVPVPIAPGPVLPEPVISSPKPELKLSSSKLVVSGNSARVRVACERAKCSGSIELSERVVVKHRKGNRTISKRETLVLGKRSYSLAAGHAATIVIRLTATGRHALAKAKHHKLSVMVSASVAGGKTVVKPILLVAAPHNGKQK